MSPQEPQEWKHGELFFEDTGTVTKFLLVPDHIEDPEEILRVMLGEWNMPAPSMTISVGSAAGDYFDPLEGKTLQQDGEEPPSPPELELSSEEKTGGHAGDGFGGVQRHPKKGAPRPTRPRPRVTPPPPADDAKADGDGGDAGAEVATRAPHTSPSHGSCLSFWPGHGCKAENSKASRSCDAIVSSNHAGTCQCESGQTYALKCGHAPVSCYDVCTNGATPPPPVDTPAPPKPATEAPDDDVNEDGETKEPPSSPAELARRRREMALIAHGRSNLKESDLGEKPKDSGQDPQTTSPPPPSTSNDEQSAGAAKGRGGQGHGHRKHQRHITVD